MPSSHLILSITILFTIINAQGPPSCVIDNGGCDANAACSFTSPTTVSCRCKPGFEDISPLVDGTNCALIQSAPPPSCDIDNGGCDGNATCRILADNTTIACECNPGFDDISPLVDGTNCTNIDDCVNANCGVGTCVDGLGNFTCDCEPFAYGDQCEILNNCYDGRDCMNGGICINDTVNGNSCNCDGTGFIGILCEVDVDECGGVEVVCGPNSSCRNTNGSFACDCDTGYEGDGTDLSIGCTNINECAINPCGANAICSELNPIPGFDCQCQSGFEGNAFDTNGEGCTLVAQQNPATISTTDDDDQSDDDSGSESDSDSSSWDDALLFMENRIKDNYGDDNNYDHETRITLDISTWSLLNIGAFMAMFVCLNLGIMCLYSSKNKKRALTKNQNHDEDVLSDESDC